MAEKLNKQPGSLERQFISVKNLFPNRVRNTALALLLAAGSGAAINLGNYSGKSPEPAQAAGEWTYGSDMRCPRLAITSAVTPDGKVFVMGGNGLEGENCEQTPIYSESNEMRDINGTWIQKAPLLKRVNNASAEYINGKIYLTGGEGVDGTFQNSLKTVQVYDLASNTWSYGPEMPKERQGHQAIAINNKLYLIGGSDKNGVTLNTIDVLDVTNNSYTSASNMNNKRSEFGASKDNTNKIYVFQGNSGDGMNPELGAEVYDPNTNSWAQLANASKSRFNFQTLYKPSENKFYNIAGRNVDSTSPFFDVEIYDPATNTYSPGSNINKSRQMFAAESYNNQLIIIGGEGDVAPKILKNTELQDPIITASPTSTSTSTPTKTSTVIAGSSATPTQTPLPINTSPTATRTPVLPVQGGDGTPLKSNKIYIPNGFVQVGH